MIELAIEYDDKKELYKIYEPSTDTLVASANLTEALVNISKFLTDSGMIKGSILDYPEISYHIDSATMGAIIENNITLMKRLNTAPSGFTTAAQHFGGSSNLSNNSSSQKQQGKAEFGRRGSTFSNSGFRKSYKKFG